MNRPTVYEIELRGNLGSRSLRSLMDDFSVVGSNVGTTRLVAVIRDASQMHGLVVHLASMNIEIISIVPAARRDTTPEPVLPRLSNPD